MNSKVKSIFYLIAAILLALPTLLIFNTNPQLLHLNLAGVLWLVLQIFFYRQTSWGETIKKEVKNLFPKK
jgi:predicted membrane protein